jgi:hypothetical protein
MDYPNRSRKESSRIEPPPNRSRIDPRLDPNRSRNERHNRSQYIEQNRSRLNEQNKSRNFYENRFPTNAPSPPPPPPQPHNYPPNYAKSASFYGMNNPDMNLGPINPNPNRSFYEQKSELYGRPGNPNTSFHEQRSEMQGKMGRSKSKRLGLWEEEDNE